MAVSPINAAAPALVSVAPAPVPAQPAAAVAPAAAAANGGGAQSATQDQYGAPKLPMDRALEEINAQLKAWSTQLQFEIDPDVHQVVVSIVDAETGMCCAPFRPRR
ncbi:flagellar protein [Bordetella pertussis]|nr:flagellar protein [Bordetella pertussis]